MSDSLMAVVPHHLVLWCVEQIDEQSEHMQLTQDVELSRGPFGVFRANEARLSSFSWSSDEFETDLHSQCRDTPFQSHERVGYPQETAWSPNTQMVFDTFFEQPDFQDLGTWHEPTDSERLQEIVTNTTNDDIVDDGTRCNPRDEVQVDGLHTVTDLPVEIVVSRTSTPITLPVDIPHGAAYLAKHYLGHVLKCLTPFQHSKTPWHILFVPEMKKCLAGLALQEKQDAASLAVFYGMLAISALSLDGITHLQCWSAHRNDYRRKAYLYAQKASASAYDIPKKAKYKTQLMTLITVTQLSILSDDRHATRRFLSEAEKLIRIRGLNRRKSRKVRLLHHCYAYERIFFESTSFSATEALQQHEHIRKAIESSGASSYSRDELSFRLSPAVDNLEIDMLRVKDQELGENDLHLQFPGQWPSSQYEEIFGLPETYLFLVSLILRLAREKNGGLEDDRPSTLSVKRFTNRAKAIERCILQYKRPRPRQNAALEHLIDAIHHALIIYFYRNIHDVDASILQGKVCDVQKALQAYDLATTGEGFACVRLVWPAFIAACEAETPEVQTWFAEWFENASQQSGLRLFDTCSTEVERVWREKRRELTPTHRTTGSVIDVF